MKISILIVVMVIVAGCSLKRNGEGSLSRYAKTFPTDMLLKDSAFQFETGHNNKLHNIDLIVRHSNQYKYSHLPLVITMIVDNKACAVDTVSLCLAEKKEPTHNYEQWKGDGFADYISLTVPYRKNVEIKQYAKVKMLVKPLMPSKYAPGVMFMGISVTNALYPVSK